MPSKGVANIVQNKIETNIKKIENPQVIITPQMN